MGLWFILFMYFSCLELASPKIRPCMVPVFEHPAYVSVQLSLSDSVMEPFTLSQWTFLCAQLLYVC